jgi:hypothetical protein
VQVRGPANCGLGLIISGLVETLEFVRCRCEAQRHRGLGLIIDGLVGTVKFVQVRGQAHEGLP